MKRAASTVQRIDRFLWTATLSLLSLGGITAAILPGGDAMLPPDYYSLGGPAKPVTLIVPSLDIEAPILPIEITQSGSLDPPSDPRDVGWWKRSAAPGSYDGQTVITGHTVHTGGGAMDHLGDLKKNRIVRIQTPKGTMDYKTTRTVVYTQAELAERAVELFSQDRQRGRLVLITCTGWTGKEYTSNVVTFAEPLGVKAEAVSTAASLTSSSG